MKMDTLQALYVDELKDLYSAENQILKALPKMIRAAGHPELKEAFTDHMKQTENQVKRLEQILESLEESPKGKKCHGMEGVLEEGAELIKEKPEADILDAGLISAAQHVEHYEMAGYGSVRTWAEKLGRDKDARLLQETLDEEHEANELLTKLALESINIDADHDADRQVGLPAESEIMSHRTPKPKQKPSSTPQPSARR
jgi:ferritin-like metal-binding protein YciE